MVVVVGDPSRSNGRGLWIFLIDPNLFSFQFTHHGCCFCEIHTHTRNLAHTHTRNLSHTHTHNLSDTHHITSHHITSPPSQFQVWDLGGQTSIRPYWRCYYPNTDAIIFVVDSADTERMPVARGELAAMLEEDELKDAILLVFANKQDQKGAMNAEQISDALGLPDVRNRQWSIQETSALKGKGLFEGFDWLVTCIKGTEE